MADLEKSLVGWVNANELSGVCTALEELNDGLMLHELLSQM
jgi:hypothetical protein